MSKNKETMGSLLVLAAGLCWGFQNVYVKMLSAYGLESMELGCMKMFIASIFFSTVVLVKDKNLFKIQLKDIWMFLGTGLVSVTLYNIFGFYTAIHGGVGIAGVLCYTSPVFIMLLSAIIFKEAITAKKILAIVLTITGCALVAGIIGSGYRFEGRVIITGLLSGLFYGLYTIFSRFALRKYDALTVTTWTFVIGFIGTLFVADVPFVVTTAVSNPPVIGWGLCLGVLGAALPYTLYTTGLSMIESGKAAILSSAELIVGTIVGVIIFDEPMDIIKVLGIILMTASIVMLNTTKKK